jgi:hypothetical protein
MSQHNATLGGLGGYSTLGIPGYSANEIPGITTNRDVGLNIKIVPATGGTIVSINDMNQIRSSDLYIIHESQDIGQELGKILTLHYLKK